jgi:phospholipid transport system substrate-binding protein
MKRRTTLLFPAVALALLGAPPAFAQQADNRSPDQVLKETIARVMEAIRSEPAAAAGDPGRIYQVVQTQFLPSTDFMLTTRYAVGAAWAKATPQQREALFRQFQTLLARTYATQLTQIQGEDAKFSYAPPPRLGPGASDAVVKSTVVAGGDRMPIDYRMHKTAAGWKIYDINMMGAWMIQVYRQQFAAQLASGGIDGLINYLAAHNQGA